MKFTKMHGAGNNYIYVNGFEETVADRPEMSRRVSDIRFGIGSDGLIVIDPSDVADCKMDIYNADGSQAMMCGNGIRCVAKFAYDNGIAQKEEISVETLSGVKTIRVKVSGGKVYEATVNMGEPILKPSDIPAKAPEVVPEGWSDELALGFPLTVDGKEWRATLVSMGNPHCVVYMDELYNALDIEKTGPLFENNAIFPNRVNTEFISVIDDKTLQMRVWERGSGETYACGTGACAAVVSSILNGYCKQDEDITVHLRGGDLTIRWSSADNCVYMTGEAVTICSGEYFER